MTVTTTSSGYTYSDSWKSAQRQIEETRRYMIGTSMDDEQRAYAFVGREEFSCPFAALPPRAHQIVAILDEMTETVQTKRQLGMLLRDRARLTAHLDDQRAAERMESEIVSIEAHRAPMLEELCDLIRQASDLEKLDRLNKQLADLGYDG